MGIEEESSWIRRACWEEILNKMPIPCVDVIVHKQQRFLMGWRVIPPYKNVWALIGGRMVRGESFEKTAIRHCLKSGLLVSNLCSLGVYPVRFRSRHDITVCVAGELKSGVPKPTEEMMRYRWYGNDEIERISPIGGNYKEMLQRWRLSPNPVSEAKVTQETADCCGQCV